MDEITALRERIQTGVALLDTLVPGWEWHIDLRKLRMESCDACVMGQLYRSYAYAPLLEYKKEGKVQHLTYVGSILYGVEDEWMNVGIACAFERPGETVSLQMWRDLWIEAIKQKRKEKNGRR